MVFSSFVFNGFLIVLFLFFTVTYLFSLKNVVGDSLRLRINVVFCLFACLFCREYDFASARP